MPYPRFPHSKSGLSFIFVALTWGWLGSSGQAAEIAVSSRIDAVTVFPTGAEISRSFTVELEAGEHTLKLLLPHDTQPNSIQIETTPETGVSISALDLMPAPIDSRDADARTADLKAQIESLETKVASYRKVEENAAFALDLVKILAQRKLQPEGLSSTPPVPDPEALTSLWDVVDERLSQISATMLDAQLTISATDTQIAELKAKLSNSPDSPPQGWLAVVHILAPKAASASFTLRHRLASASWKPVYEARLETNTAGQAAGIVLVRNAVVVQTTTEDWSDVALSLSTAQRNSSTAAPSLKPQSINQFTNEVEDERTTVSAGLNDTSNLAENVTGVTEDTARANASASNLGFNILYAIPGRVTIDNSGTSKTVRIGSSDGVAELFLTAVPKLDLTAYLGARFTVNIGTPLLPGRVMLFRNEVFVGEGQVPLTPQGGDLILAFGADDLVTVERTEVGRKSGESGLVSTAYVEERSYLTRITSSHAFSIPITIEDQVPISDDDRIRVDLLQGTAPPDEVDSQSGAYSWTIMLDPDIKEDVLFGFRVSWPKGMFP